MKLRLKTRRFLQKFNRKSAAMNTKLANLIEFKSALITGDSYDANLVTGTISSIWAYGSSDTISTIHKQRGYGQIQI